MNHTSEYTMSLWTQAQADIDTGQGERKGERQKHSVSVYHCVTHTHARKATDFERVLGVDVYLER